MGKDGLHDYFNMLRVLSKDHRWSLRLVHIFVEI